MRSTMRTAVSAGLLALAGRASAQVASVCPESNVCFKLNIPSSTASSGNGDIFFQISAPSTYEWVALGQGQSMGGSNMFLVYTSSGGSNVTLSPRTTSGHNAPSFNSNAQVALLEGSGVANGVMTANVKCSNCNSWSGGTMDFKASSGNWIYAYQPRNGPKNTNDQSASIQQHTGHDSFKWDFANAKGGSSVNPLVNAAPSGTGSGGSTVTSCIQRNAASAAATTSSAGAPAASQTSRSGNDDNQSDDRGRPTRIPSTFGSFPTARPTSRPYDTRDESSYFAKRQNLPYCDELPNGGNSNSGNSGFTSTGGGSSNTQSMLIAHGVLASLAFVILFPSGAIAVRLASFPGIVWIHGAFQVFAFLVYIAAFGLGVYLASQNNLLNHYHPIIGIVVLVLVFLQPIGGFLHHTMFKKYGHRTMWSYAHVWGGRVAITLGIINGGLGLKFADGFGLSSKKGMIAYGVVAGIMWLAWVAASFIGERRRSAAAPPKYEGRSRSNESDAAETAPPADGHYAPKNR